MGYSNNDKFFNDLSHLVHFFDLIVAIVDPKSLSWIDLSQAQERFSLRRSDIERRHLRIYTEADFETRWSGKLGWSENELSSDEATALALIELVQGSEQSRSYWADVFEIDPSTLSKILRGKRQCPQILLANFTNLVEFRGLTGGTKWTGN